MRARAVAVFGFGFALCVACAGRATESNFASRLDAALAVRALRGAQVSALVVSRDDGRALYARKPDRPLIPASNQKILTAIAALSAYGPTYRFVTSVYADPLPDDDGVVDVLAIRGQGDPALTSEQLWRLAADLRRLGVRRVRKGLLLDATAFDAERWHETWGPISSRAYHAPVAALSANYGAFAAIVKPGARAGDSVGVTLDPGISYLRVVNHAATGNPRGANSLVVDRRAAGSVEEVTLSGVVRAASDIDPYHRSVLDPVRYAGAVLRMQLEANGIVVAGEDRVGAVDAGLTPILEFEGKPLGEIVALFLKYSNNSMAEMILKAMGARHSGGLGNWPTGVAAVRAELATLGVDRENLSLVDGSGLSYENRVTPRTLVSALRAADESFRFGPEFVAALPIAAADGTLEKRTLAAAGRVRAKTGLLQKVKPTTALSGYAESILGERFVFSILVNGFSGRAEDAMDAVDGFAAILVQGGVDTPDQN